MGSCKTKTKAVCPQRSRQKGKRKEKRGLPGVRRAVRSQVPGERGKLGEVGEWQCEVRWGHEGWWQGESRAPWAMLVEGNGGISSESVITNSILEEKEGEIPEIASYIGEHLYSYPPAARNQPSWVLILR